MKYTKILFPTDFSSASNAGLAHATALARDSGAMLIILHVEEPAPAYVGELYYGMAEPDHAELKRMLDKVVPPDTNVRYEHRMFIGDPADVIVETAEKEHTDLIVLGTHGRTGLRRLLMGSVAEAVVRRSSCPVLTFREPKQSGVAAK